MTDTDLIYLPAHEALARFRAKTLSPVELMEATIRRAEAVQPQINAFTYTHFDEAMDQARKAEAKYARAARTGALEGLPIGIKDESEIAGKPMSSGSRLFRDTLSERTSVNNARILAAGGIVHARTATPEFSSSTVTWSRAWGVTRNPWNPAFTPGGSSGGAGAALAAGSSALCTGSDIGGSIRIPASATGTVGLKPSYGRNPDDAPFNLDFFCHTGPMARSVTDAILLQNVMCGPTPRDIASLRPKLRLPTTYQPIKGWKIALSLDLGFYEVAPEVRANTLAAAQVFRDLGAEVTEVALPWTWDTVAAGGNYLRHLFGAYISQLLPDHAEDLTTYARQFAEEGRESKATTFIDSLETINAMYESLGPILERHHLLICPTTALPAIPADYDHSSGTTVINGKTVDPIMGWVMTLPFNMLSRCPVLSVPSGRAANGVPTGLQLVGRTYRDQDVMRAGLAFETAVGGWFGPGARPPI